MPSLNQIFVRTDKGEYFEGDTIYGTVFLNIVQAVPAKSLELTLKGYEKVFWQYTETEWETDDEGNNHAKTVVRDHGGEKTFFKDSFKLIDYPGGFPVGSYAYPFQYTLPHGLPGVFLKKKDHPLSFKAKIAYVLKAELDIPDAHDLKIKQSVTIHERLDKAIQPKHEIGKREVMTLCCIPRGPVKCEVWLDKNAYVQGETCQVYVKVDNDSSVEIVNFKVKLIREVKLTDGHGHHTESRQVVCINTYDGTKPKSKKECPCPLQLITKKGKGIKPSTDGNLVKCKYTIMVEMSIPWAPDLEIYQHVVIYTPENPYWLQWQPPAWLPQVQYTQSTIPQLVVPQEVLDKMIADAQHGQTNNNSITLQM